MQLRPVREHDLAWLLELRQEDNLLHHNTHHCDLETQKEWLESLDSNSLSPTNVCFCGYFTHSSPKTSLGYFYFQNIDWTNRTADVSWGLRKDFRGAGLGKQLVAAGGDYARNSFILRRLNGEILSPNIPSKVCAEAAGFVPEGTKRKAVVRHGETYDSLVFGLLLDDALTGVDD